MSDFIARYATPGHQTMAKKRNRMEVVEKAGQIAPDNQTAGGTRVA